MSACAEVHSRRLLGEGLDGRGAAHAERCPRCIAAEPALRALARRLEAGQAVPGPSHELAPRVLLAAGPLLARNRRLHAVRQLVRAIGAALLPLPLILVADAWLVRSAYALLSTVLPGMVSLYLVASYVALLAVLLGLAYGAIPLLADRQLRLRREFYV